ncbi:hypothetical protein KIN20_037167 [Parelaphostrongylus tenuis]|uniref:Uncharacterized protein n=1 Tax=Parelaphostrongylus tenuis TaxID=148309 RepID=A0AAD5RE68_PARTN|nr:hypothetical protein KIN20_037167 [Parelaphostrongylus tenuis]
MQRLEDLSWANTFWFSVENRADNTNLKDQLQSGPPREVDQEVVIEAAEKDSTLTIEEPTDDFGCVHATTTTV